MMSRTGNKLESAFTLVEVMVSTCVLSIGAVLIYEALFISLDSFNYYSNSLNITPWMDEKIWQAQDKLSHFGVLTGMETSGNFINRNKNFGWSLSHDLIDQMHGLYKIDLTVSWQEGKKRRVQSRNAYAIYKEK